MTAPDAGSTTTAPTGVSPRDAAGLRLGQGDAHVGKIMVGHPPHRKAPGPPGQAPDDAPGERVAKALARAGVASRRDVERLITAGRVALNGQVLTTPAVKVSPGDILTVDGAVVDAAEATRVFRYHKPAGLVATNKDPQGRKTVFEALPPGLPRLISVGRLDLRVGRSAAADQRRRTGPRARTSRDRTGAALTGRGPWAGSTRRGWTPSRAESRSKASTMGRSRRPSTRRGKAPRAQMCGSPSH